MQKFFADTAAIVAGDVEPLDLEDMPSDDTEDDDYDPDALELPDDRQREGSSSEESDGTNDISNSCDSSSDDEGSESGEGSESDEASQFSLEGESENFSEHLVGSRKKKIKMARDENAQEISELPKDSDIDEKDDISPAVSGKRRRQEVDYKKLHDVSCFILSIVMISSITTVHKDYWNAMLTCIFLFYRSFCGVKFVVKIYVGFECQVCVTGVEYNITSLNLKSYQY